MVSITICTRTRPSTVYFEWLWLENVILFLLDSADILVTQIPGELKIVQGLQPSKLAHGFSIYLHPSHANRSGVELRITSITWTLYSSLFLLEWSLDIISQQGSLMCCSEKKYCHLKRCGPCLCRPPVPGLNPGSWPSAQCRLRGGWSHYQYCTNKVIQTVDLHSELYC